MSEMIYKPLIDYGLFILPVDLGSIQAKILKSVGKNMN